MYHGPHSENWFQILQVDSLMGPSLVELAEMLIKGVKEGKVANGRSVYSCRPQLQTNSHSILLTNCPDPWNFSRKYFQLLLLRPQSDTRKVVLTQ